ITYTIEEELVDGYVVYYDGYDLTNIEKTTVSVEKTWEGKAQDSVTVHLLADGEKVDTIELSDENDWVHTFDNLPAVRDTDEEEAIVYSVEEVEIDGYDSEITGNAEEGFVVINDYIIPTTDLEIKKQWVDSDEN